MAQLVSRLAFGALGALMLHDSLMWSHRLVFGRLWGLGGSVASASLLAQRLWRTCLAIVGCIVVLAAAAGPAR